jgi:hypothetical protein
MRDVGMTESQAATLAETVRQASGHTVEVAPDDSYFCVHVVKGRETYTLYDEADWDWLKGRILAD